MHDAQYFDIRQLQSGFVVFHAVKTRQVNGALKMLSVRAGPLTH